MYDHLLRVVAESHDLSAANLPAYLRSLQPTLKNLRTSFQTSTQVRVDYADPSTQAAYMLAYFPHHVLQTAHNLDRACRASADLRALFQHDRFHVTLLGAGPTPEAVAVVQQCQRMGGAAAVNIVAFDRDSRGWAPARTLARQLAQAISPNVRLAYRSHALDLSRPNALTADAISALCSSQLVIMQNCINEIVNRDASALASNVEAILEAMPARSTLLLADLKYHPTRMLMRAIGDRLHTDARFSVICPPDLEEISVRRSLPHTLRQNLLTGENGLIPRAYVKQYVLGIVKQSSQR